MKCVDACEFDALKLTSTLKSVDEIFADVMKDDLFYESSGGGFTVSGGEPLMHPDMTMALLKRAKQEGLHTVLDTTGFANWNIIKSILEYVDLVLFDIKQLDDVKHKKWTGVSNRLILENAQKMAQSGIKMRLRLPIIHSVNFWDLQYPKDIVEFAKPLGKSIIGSKLINIDKGKCLNCFQCVDACDFNALIISGKFVTVDEVIKEIEKDIPFYEQSGGGLTISGGEPTAQPQFALELLKAAKERGINTALDTSGYQSWSILEEILDYTDYVLYDLKHLDRNQHIAFTGVPNDLILENLEKIILRDDVTTYIRMPLLPGVNDSEENIRATGEYVKSLGLKTLYLLPAHPFAGQSYRLVGIDYPFPIGESYPEEKANIAKEILESYGLDVKLWIAWVEDNVSDKSQLKESAKIQTGTV
jgi:pyruvate formate lyase activating enzyme